MERGEPTVVAVCASAEEALAIVNRLTQDGYHRDRITVYAPKGTTGSFEGKENVRIEKEEEEKGVWDKVKGVFQSDQENTSDFLEPYRTDLQNGKYVLAVEGYRGELGYMTERRTEETQPGRTDDAIELKEERLDVDKREVKTGDVDVSKRVVKDVERVEVPVEREELVVEKRSYKDGDGEPETIRIPLKEEEVEVTKKPVVKEEVSVRKEVTEETQQVTGDVKKERLDVDTHGEAHVRDTKQDNPPAK